MSRTAKGRNDQRKMRVAKRILPSRSHLVAGGSIEGNDELDGGGAVVANLDTLAKHAGGFVPRDNGVAAGRHAVEGELAGPIRHRAPAVGSDDDHRAHVRMEVAADKDYSRPGEGDDAGLIFRIIAEIEGSGPRQ